MLNFFFQLLTQLKVALIKKFLLKTTKSYQEIMQEESQAHEVGFHICDYLFILFLLFFYRKKRNGRCYIPHYIYTPSLQKSHTGENIATESESGRKVIVRK